MALHPLAGKPAPQFMLPNIPKLISSYFLLKPDPQCAEHAVAFGTSGHRGTSGACTFNEDHILAVVQAICMYRKDHGATGPLYLGKDTHALSEPAQMTAIEVLAANGVQTLIHRGGGDPGHLARHSHLQPRPQLRVRRWHRHHAVAQSARRRRHQVQPARRRPRRHDDHQVDCRQGQRTAA